MAALGTPGGVVSDEDHRLAMAGMIAPQTSTLAVRTGVLWGPGSTALVTGTSATGTMTVAVAPLHLVSTRGAADGVYLGTLAAATTVTIAAAPGSNSRIDVVYVKQNDSGSSVSPDGATTFVADKVTGTAAASPTKPSIPVGAVEIATVTVAAGATATNGAGVTIANTAVQTVARGARIPVRNQTERDALTAFAGLEVYRIDTGDVELSSGSAWSTVYDAVWATFTPTWTTSGTGVVAPAVGNGTLVGRYSKVGRTVHFSIDLLFGSTTSGGVGAMAFSLPVAATSGRRQVVALGLDTNNAGLTAQIAWDGHGRIESAATTVALFASAADTASSLRAVASATGGATAGTGNPTIAGQFTFGPGSRITISGTYEAAS